MAFEVLNVAQTTPRRLLTLLRLMQLHSEIDRDRLLNLLQPPALVVNQKAATAVLNSAIDFGFITEDPGQRHVYHLSVDHQRFQTTAAYRRLMQDSILGRTDSLGDNYLFNEYLAWYASQNARVFRYSRDEFHILFNEALYPEKRDEQAFNSTKFAAWRTWAAFLGCGWLYRIRRGGAIPYLIPDATDRIVPLIDSLLPETGDRVLIRTFTNELSEQCPELDGGVLFKRASQGSAPAGNQLSLMLSNALRRLEAIGKIALDDVADTADRWRLYPSTGSTRQYVTHIRQGGIS